MPFLLIPPLAAIALGASLEAEDQRKKRKAEAEFFHAEISRITTQIASLQVAHDVLVARLGAQSDHVRALAAEIVRLRAQLASYQCTAA